MPCSQALIESQQYWPSMKLATIIRRSLTHKQKELQTLVRRKCALYGLLAVNLPSTKREYAAPKVQRLGCNDANGKNYTDQYNIR